MSSLLLKPENFMVKSSLTVTVPMFQRVLYYKIHTWTKTHNKWKYQQVIVMHHRPSQNLICTLIYTGK